MVRLVWVAVAAALLTAQGASAQEAGAKPKFGDWGFDLSARDLSVRPGKDFYVHAQGTAVRTLALPPDRLRLSRFDILTMEADEHLRALLEQAARDPADPLGAYYAAYMDEAGANAREAAPLAGDLAAVRAAASLEDMARLHGANHLGLGRGPFDLRVDVGFDSPSRHVLFLGQFGLGLGGRAQYLDAGSRGRKADYQRYVAEMLTLAGWPNAAANAKAIVALETRIAEASAPWTEQRDLRKINNPMSLAELEARAPDYPWRAFMQGAGAEGVGQVVVTEPAAVPKIAAIVRKTPLEVLRAWQAFGLIDTAAPFLSSDFVDARFRYREAIQRGLPLPAPRWRRAVDAVNSTLADAAGQRYVAAHFSQEDRRAVAVIAEGVKAAMARRIAAADWMSDPTKARALDKLAKLRVRLGHPDRWRDYGGLQLSRDDPYGNAVRVQAFEWRGLIGRVGQPNDDDEWDIATQKANGYYDPQRNELVVTAALLQPPFFDRRADPAVNYGAIGALIGHQIVSGFDEDGRQFDADGRVADWWTPADLAEYRRRAGLAAEQYGRLGLATMGPIVGGQTTAANLADLGGVVLALDAYDASLNGAAAPVLDGLSGDQRLFLGWAQMWMTGFRQAAFRNTVANDLRAVPQVRAIGPLRNIDAWYDAFEVQPSDVLYLPPEERIRIW